MATAPDSTAKRWDIFCKVIDNYGDLGVCWRLATDLGDRGHQVRLIVDDPAPLQWMAPDGHPSIQVLRWVAGRPRSLGDVVLAAFSCQLDGPTLSLIGERLRSGTPPAWINLEYLSAETFSERAHGCAAPVLNGPAAGTPRVACYPGFTAATGGLLREPDLAQRQALFDRTTWLAKQGVEPHGELLLSMFCYEPAALDGVLRQWAQGSSDVTLLACAGRGAEAVRRALPAPPQPGAVHHRTGRLTTQFLPWLSQRDYDHLLWCCDLNFVRGEDSLVRAIWANKPWIWQIYPQSDGAHEAKLQALMDRMQASPTMRRFSKGWNGVASAQCDAANLLESLPGLSADAQAWQRSLLAQQDLTTQLIRMAAHSS